MNTTTIPRALQLRIHPKKAFVQTLQLKAYKFDEHTAECASSIMYYVFPESIIAKHA